MKFNEFGFTKIKSKQYGDTIYICKYDWIAKQAARKGHIAYYPEELEEFRKMTKQEQDIWHEAKKIFGGHYVGKCETP